METFFITLIFLIGFVVLMALGVIFSNKELKGSCGGIGRVMGNENKPCEFCHKPNPCENYKEYRERKKEVLAARLQS